jgi:tRNA(fMet)-specific endonuclease VapC
MIVVDTDVCVEILRGNDDIVRRRRNRTENVSVSFMTVAELYFGAFKSQRPDHNKELVERFLLTVGILHSDIEVLETFGKIKSNLQRSGEPLADADVLIAATALSKGAVLATGNLGHYERIEGLQLEDWIRV